MKPGNRGRAAVLIPAGESLADEVRLLHVSLFAEEVFLFLKGRYYS
jgi:hypothetical protein